jgi:ketosteroid isomerase-like protein
MSYAHETAVRSERMPKEIEVRKVIEDWARAVAKGDRKAILARHSNDVRMFDFNDELRGLKAYDKTWDFFYADPRGPIKYVPRDMDVSAGDDIAFASCLFHCDGTSAGPLEFRLTVGLRRVDGDWSIVHEHHSVRTVEERFLPPKS